MSMGLLKCFRPMKSAAARRCAERRAETYLCRFNIPLVLAVAVLYPIILLGP